MNNQLVKINDTDLAVKEFNGQRVVTFKDIDMLHERVEGTAKRNFSDNKKHFVKNVDYYELSKSDVGTDFVLTYEFDKKAPKGILLTESGYLMLVKSLQDDLAWKVQRELVNNYFRVKENGQALNTSELSPELQMFNQMFKAIANQELEQKKIKAEIQDTKDQLQGIRDVVALTPNAWRKDTASLISKIAMKLGGFDYIKDVRDESYKILNETYKVDIKRRLVNKKKNMALEGCSKSKISKLTYLDVIAEDEKLINGYINIIGKMAIKYGVDMN